jgi:secretion/DNA translocation related TadE-like protein
MSSSERSSERGSATVLVLVLATVLTTLAIAATTVGGILVGHRRAAAAADLAALAAAEALVSGGVTRGGPDGCGQAALVSGANDARLTACEVEGRDVVVAVTVDVRMPFGATRSVPGRARAGPAEVSSSGGPGR